MSYPLIFSIVIKVINLLAIPIVDPVIHFIILLATPISLPHNKLDSKDGISLILWSMSCLIYVGIMSDSHFLFNLTNVMSWTWLIVECFIGNLTILNQRKHKLSHSRSKYRK